MGLTSPPHLTPSTGIVSWDQTDQLRRDRTASNGRRGILPGEPVQRATDFVAYEAEFCPAAVVETNHHGRLERKTTRAAPARLAAALHCLPESVVLRGTHPDRRFD
jgi:hypothetical protein